MEDFSQGIEPFRRMFPFQPHFFQYGNQRLHYVDEGKGNLLLLLHACPMWSFSFRDVINEFKRDHRVIAIDQLGFGLSDKPYNYDYKIETHIDQLERFVNRLNLKDITLVMHGRGSTIGMGYAVRHPSNVRAFVTMNSMAFSDYVLPWRLELCRIKFLGAKIIMGLQMFQAGLAKFPPEIRYAYRYPFPNKDSRIALLRFIEDIPCAPEDESAQSMFEIESALWMFRDRPSCIIWAMKDWLYKLHNLKKWTQYLPNAEVHRISRAGRYLAEDAPDELIGLLREFLKKHGI